MSKQSDAKKEQGYIEKPVNKTCSNCINFVFDIDIPQWAKDSGYTIESHPHYAGESNKRCFLGGFAAKKTATCKYWGSK